MSSFHVCRAWSPPDPFAPACGCEVLPCGFIDAETATEKGCKQHSTMASKSIRSGHPSDRCPQPTVGSPKMLDARCEHGVQLLYEGLPCDVCNPPTVGRKETP